MTSKIIAIFGGSRVDPGSAEYDEAYSMGKLLGGAGYVVLNGGYAGTMEASARGAKESGGRAIGVISKEFNWLSPNAYIDETVVQSDLFDRIRHMQSRSDAFVVLKGSMGTLAELALVWNISKIDTKQRKPIILVGNAWSKILDSWCEHLAVTNEDAQLLFVAKNPTEALDQINRVLKGRAGMPPSPPTPSPE